MSGPRHRTILASAGTGKTYQLSGRFLALLFSGVPPERILATTFTRKAAGEILDRVLKRLVEAVEDPKNLVDLNAQLADEGVGRQDAASCRELLAGLARGLHRFRIRTLDAYFVQLAGVFALELGLPPEWRILDEDEIKGLQHEALADALAEAKGLEVLELLRAMQKTDASRTVGRSLLRTVDEGRDAFLDSDEAAWDKINVPEGLEKARFKEVLEELEVMPLAKKKNGEEYANWINARRVLLEFARDGDWEEALGQGFLAKLAAGETKFGHGKFDEDHLAVLEPLMEHAAHCLLDQTRRQNLASHAWLTRFEDAFFARKDLCAGLSFEDVPRALAPADGTPLAAAGFDLGFRLDGRVDHLLLDEFQDTAPTQWRVLEPLAEEIAATGDGERSFFCVGDVKQSIYAWRSGEPRLLEGMTERFPALPPPEQLVENWRSSPIVLDTVDRVFRGLDTSSHAFSKHAAHLSAAMRWREGYQDHVAARTLPGSVHLFESRAPYEGESAELPPLEFAAARAVAIAAEAPHASIAVLLRRNNHVPRMIDLLRRRGLRASGEGGNPLTDSAAVLHALSALHLADHPGDSAAAFHVVTSPLAEALGAIDADVEEPHRLSLDLRQRLASSGFGEFLAEFLPTVEAASEYGPWDAKRYSQLIDLGYAFDRRGALRTTAFLDFVRDTKVEDPASTQVKVMTIHASKGLEFDAVLLPELDLSMTLREPSTLRSRPDPEASLAAVSTSRPHAICGLDPEGLGAIRREEDERHVQEALCLLYVAMTRAAHRLELVVRPPKHGTRTLSYATVLRGALGDSPGDSPGELWVHPDNKASWWPEAPTGGPPATEELRRRPRFKEPLAPRDLPRRSPSAEEGGSSIAINELLKPRHSRSFTRGTLIHRFLEEIEWLEDFDATDDELRTLAEGIEQDTSAVSAALVAFRRALEQPAMRELLMRPVTGDELEVWRERSFSEVVDGEIWSGSFDRVVLHRRQGKPERAEVVDYKTDRVKGEELDQRVDYYGPQVESYRRVLERMTGLSADRVSGSLAFLEAGIRRSPKG